MIGVGGERQIKDRQIEQRCTQMLSRPPLRDDHLRAFGLQLLHDPEYSFGSLL
ncbi:hypothetical protein ABIA40_000401 [Bradyrhizobium sp. USDA 223]